MSPQNSSFIIRSFRDSQDFEYMASIFNNSAIGTILIKEGIEPERTGKFYKNHANPDRILIVEVDSTPYGFICGWKHVERRTSKGIRWDVSVPFCLSTPSQKAIEESLLHAFKDKAREEKVAVIGTTIPEKIPFLGSQLEEWGFRKTYAWYTLRTKLAKSPTGYFSFPTNTEVIPTEDAEALWEITQHAFGGTPGGHTSLESVRYGMKLCSLTLLCREVTTKKPIGFIEIADKGPQRKEYGSFGLAVIPDYQKQGIGTALIYKAMCYFWEKGIHDLEIDTGAKNETALKLYKLFNFKVVPEMTQHSFERILK